MGGYFTAMSRCTRSAFRTSAVVCGPVPGLCNRGTCPVSEEEVPNPAREIEKPAGRTGRAAAVRMGPGGAFPTLNTLSDEKDQGDATTTTTTPPATLRTTPPAVTTTPPAVTTTTTHSTARIKRPQTIRRSGTILSHTNKQRRPKTIGLRLICCPFVPLLLILLLLLLIIIIIIIII